jgi:hypothetical protein
VSTPAAQLTPRPSVANPTPAPTRVPAPTATPKPTLAPKPAPTPEPAIVTVTGQVMRIDPNGDFVLNDGRVGYTVVMSLTTKVINLRGREVPRQFIQVANSVTVTGLLRAPMMDAQTVLIPTRKDGA